MQDFLGRPIKVGDFLFGGVGYGNTIWEVLDTMPEKPKGKNFAVARLANGDGFSGGVDVNLSQFILLTKKELTLYYLLEK